jgi:exodeoxyribonuclease VII large subunit
MENGQEVIVIGSIQVYERDGRYQMYAKEIVLDGAGLLFQRFAQLKQELEEMGMFAPEYKQPIPAFAQKVGIVTAPTGAAVRDIIQVAKRRNPYVQLVLYPALVQGEGAAASIVQGIEALENHGVDVMIVGRGGGSMEDLWAFNEEEVARAVFHCSVPIISAVGHETDTTIIDFVADLRAPTPSAAAELAVYEASSALLQLQENRMRMQGAMMRNLSLLRSKIEQKSLRLQLLHPRHKLNEQRQYVVDLEQRMRSLMEDAIRQRRHRFLLYVEQFKGLSPLTKLSHGYAYVQTRDAKTLRSIGQVEREDTVSIYLQDGQIQAKVIERTEGWTHGGDEEGR